MKVESMMRFKICILGDEGVGKTSLVRRFVHRTFSEIYSSTIGVRIDRKTLVEDGHEVELLVWDLAGGFDNERLLNHYLKGARGVLYVGDGTRMVTILVLTRYQRTVREQIGEVPGHILINKADLALEWTLARANVPGPFAATSALTGEGVDGAFADLTRRILQDAKQTR